MKLATFLAIVFFCLSSSQADDDLSNKHKFDTISGHRADIWCVAISPDGKKTLTGSGVGRIGFGRDSECHLRLWEIGSRKETLRLKGHNGWVFCVAFLDGEQAISGGAHDDRTLRLWNLKTGKEIRRFVGHGSAVNSIKPFPNSSKILSGSEDGTIRIWDIATGKELVQIPIYVDEGIFRLSFIEQTLVFVFTGKIRKTLPVPPFFRDWFSERAPVKSVDVSRDAKIALCGCRDGSIRLFDLEKKIEIRKIIASKGVLESATFSPDGKKIGSAVNRLSPDGDDFDNFVQIWDVATGKLECQLKGHRAPIYCVAFSPNGRRILSCGGRFDLSEEKAIDCKIRIWDLLSKKMVCSFSGHSHEIRQAVFSPDGQFVVSVGIDQTVRLWRLTEKPPK